MIGVFLTIFAKVFITFSLLFFGCLVTADETNSDLGTKSELSSSFDRLFNADLLIKQGRVSAAGRIYQSLAHNPKTNSLIKELATKKVNQTYNNQSSYKRSLSVYPFRSRRNFKSDIVYLEINGSNIPFVLNRTQPRHTYLNFEHSLSSWLWYHFPKSLVDEFRITHNLSLFDNENVSNNFRASLFTNEVSFIDEAELFVGTEIGSSTNYDQYNFGLETIATFNVYQFGFATEKTLFSNDQLGFDEQINSKFSLERSIKEYVIFAEHCATKFSNETLDFTTNSLSISRPLDIYFSNASLEYSKRTDEEIQFPYQKLRKDNLITVSVDKVTNLFGIKNQVKLAAAFNDSSLDTNSYNELQFDFQFMF